MNTFQDILLILLPLICVSGISIFVVFRLKYKYAHGTLGKKKTKNAQMILDSLIPLGMVVGAFVAVLISLFSSISLQSVFSWGAGGGFLLGYIAYEIYGRKKECHL